MLVGQYLHTGAAYGYTDGSPRRHLGGRANAEYGPVLWIGSRAVSSGFPMTGDIACALLVKGDLADSDRQKIEGRMAMTTGSANPPADVRWKLFAAKGDLGPAEQIRRAGSGGGGIATEPFSIPAIP